MIDRFTAALVLALAFGMLPSGGALAKSNNLKQLGLGMAVIPDRATKDEIGGAAGRTAAGQMRAHPNRLPHIEGTDIESLPLPILPPGSSRYDYPHCCGIHCSCDPSR